jgi:glutaredoxin
VCEETIELVKRIACPSCDVNVLDMNAPEVTKQAKKLGISSVPSVVINGKVADCCEGHSRNEATLRKAGIGIPLP